MGGKASKAATARNKRALAPTLNIDLASRANVPKVDLSTAMDVADAEHVAPTRRTRLSRQPEADACIEYWNQAIAVEGSFADEYVIL